MLFLIEIVSCQIINFPDTNFKAKLLAANTTTNFFAGSYSSGNFYPWMKIDANNDGEIEISEAQLVYSLYLFGSLNSSLSNISDLTGIEYFTSLETLYCANNNLTTINLTNLINLKNFSCQNNQINDLNISELTNLITLTCQYNQIPVLDFTNLLNIVAVNCAGNLITELDFHNSSSFRHLSCANNPNLITINLKNGVIQSTNPTIYNSDCFYNCPNLINICADTDEIQSLQNYLSICNSNACNISFSSNCELANNNFMVDNFIGFPNPFKNSFKISLSQLKSDNVTVKVYDVLGKSIETLNLSFIEFETIELGKNYKSGVYNILVQQNSNFQTLRVIKE